MATQLNNLSNFNIEELPNGSEWKLGIVVSEWNEGVTSALLTGAIDTLKKANVPDENIDVSYVPGSFELPYGASLMARSNKYDAVICIGCVIQGETRHFDFICDAVANGVTRVSLDSDKPVIFGVLTTDNLEQAQARAGGQHGNKGDEAAVTALKMLTLKASLKQ